MGKSSVLVLGANSFSGSHFIARALAAGYRVFGASRSPEPAPVFLAHRWKPAGGYSFHRIDLNQDLDRLMELIRRERPAYVVNFAAQGMVAESWRRPEDWFRTNTLAQAALHQRLRDCDFLEKYVHISTPEVYGSTAGTIRENDVYRPATPYAVSRAAADMFLAALHRTWGFPVVFTRAANVYGPGQQLYRLLPRAALAFLTGGVLELQGGGVAVRSFIHIRDVAEATLRIMEKAPAGEIYHLATDRRQSIRELVALFAALAGASFEERVRLVPGRPGEDPLYALDSAKARAELGWAAAVPLEDGLLETLAWVRDHLEELRHLPWEYCHKT